VFAILIAVVWLEGAVHAQPYPGGAVGGGADAAAGMTAEPVEKNSSSPVGNARRDMQAV
jgi:hypothetical protein